MQMHCPSCGVELKELESFSLVALVGEEELGLRTGEIKRFVCPNENGRNYVLPESGVLIALYVFQKYLKLIGDW